MQPGAAVKSSVSAAHAGEPRMVSAKGENRR